MSPPSKAALTELTELGQWLDTVAETDRGEARIAPRTRTLLLWAPRPQALIVLIGFKLPRPQRAEPPPEAAAVYEEWTRGREATQVRELQVKWPAGRFADLGPALSIGYRSDKFGARGRTTDYEHKFGPGVRLYQLGSDGHGRRRVLAWRGGRLRITEDGIEG